MPRGFELYLKAEWAQSGIGMNELCVQSYFPLQVWGWSWV